MAGIRLEDIISEQRKLLTQGDQRAQATIDRLESIAKSVSESDKIHKQDRLLQLAQTVEAVKADKDDDRIVKATEKGLLDTTGDGLNANMLKLIEAIKSRSIPAAMGNQSLPFTPPSSTPALSAKTLEERSREQAAKYNPTFNERMGYQKPEKGSGIKGVMQSAVNMFKGGLKLENFIDTEGPPSGIWGGEIRRKIDRKKFVEDQLATGATTNPELAGKRFDKMQSEQAKLAKINKDIEGMRARGLTEDQIARTGQPAAMQKALRNISIADPLTREKYASGDVAVPLKGASPAAALPDSDVTTEEEGETSRMMGDQMELLARIEENTRGLKNLQTGGGGGSQPQSEEDSNGLGLSDLLSSGTKGLKKGAGKLLSYGKTALGGLRAAGGAIATRAAPALASVGGLGGIAAAAAPAAIAYGAANLVDWGAGKLGIGKDAEGNDIQVDEAQDEANWNKMSGLQKVGSGIARGIEKIGSFAGFSNIARSARASRIAAESGGVTSSSVTSGGIESMSLEDLKAKRDEIAAKGPATESAQSIMAHRRILASFDKAIAAKESGGGADTSKTQPVTGDASVGAPNMLNAGDELREQASKLGIDPNNAVGKKEGGVLTSITDSSTGKVYPLSIPAEKQSSVNAARAMRAANENSANLAANASAPQPRMADAVYGKSSENAAASTSAKQASAPVVVSAPQTTNIQQTQNRLDPGTPRNTESSWRAYNKSKYAF